GEPAADLPVGSAVGHDSGGSSGSGSSPRFEVSPRFEASSRSGSWSESGRSRLPSTGPMPSLDSPRLNDPSPAFDPSFAAAASDLLLTAGLQRESRTARRMAAASLVR